MQDGEKNAKHTDKKHPPIDETAKTVTGDSAEPPRSEAPPKAASDANAGTPGGSAAGDVKTGPERMAQLEAENTELKDKYLRKYAEFENYKKRINKEREESAKFSNAMLLLDIVGTIDNFELAIKSAEDGKDFKTFHSGITLIEKQLVSTLEKKWGLERFSAKGAAFDPERHEALMAEESPNVKAATVVEDFQSGYLLHGRVLRPAKVKVLQPASENKSQPASGENDSKGN
ncbi:MAG: nucleotide exchange factor GrpE [Spirochaetales bacterium]|nr:nucleotide exchange factor GrpE [Spirochaetales bacterium]